MGVIFKLDEYVVLKNFSYDTAIFNKTPPKKTVNFKKGQKIFGFPTGGNVIIDVDGGYKLYLPTSLSRNVLRQTGRKIDLSTKTKSGVNKYCFNYSVEGILTILPTYKCACAANSTEALRIVAEYAKSQKSSRKTTIYNKPFPPNYANPSNLEYLDKIQTIKESCMDSYSQALGYGIFCGRNCAEQKIAAGIPPVGARRASKSQDATSDAVLAQAALESTRGKEKSWTPLQVTGVVAASLMGIALMVVIIKKAKKK